MQETDPYPASPLLRGKCQRRRGSTYPHIFQPFRACALYNISAICMNFLHKIFSSKKIVLTFAAFAAVFFFSKMVFAVWDGANYDPGETLNPECTPAQANCDVAAPLTSANISDTVYGAGWNADTTHAPSKNTIYDKIETLGTGTVISVSVVTANGVSGSVATATTTPAITLTLGAITPTSVNGNIFTTGSSTYTGTAGQTY